MTSHISSAIVFLGIVGLLGDAPAQGIGQSAQPPLPAGFSAADCEQLAALPHSPISVEACKAMMGLGAGFDAAAANPSAQRLGDDAMTCTQIFGELKAIAGVGISDANAAKSEAVVKDGTALATRQAGEMTAFIAESYALGAGMGLVGAVTPNFVGAAIAAAGQARVTRLPSSTRCRHLARRKADAPDAPVTHQRLRHSGCSHRTRRYPHVARPLAARRTRA